MNTVDALAGAIRATRFVGAYEFEWFGKRPAGIVPGLRRVLDADALRAHRDAMLCQKLYENFYCHGYARPIRWLGGNGAAQPKAGFVRRLVEAHPGGSWRDPGWIVTSLSPPRAVISRAGLSVTAFIEELDHADTGGPAVGDDVALRRPPVLPGVSPGYLTVAGDTPFPQGAQQLLRHYWNVSADGAPALIGALGRTLDRHRVAFRLKVVASPLGYDRCDSAVLYTLRTDHVLTHDLVGAAWRKVARFLANEVPVFCLRLAPGLGLAEDPPGQESFGLNRCRLLAEGLIAAHAAGLDDAPARLTQVIAAFESAGVSLDRPHLNPGSTAGYRIYSLQREVATGACRSDDDVYGIARRATATIATQLRHLAIGHHGRCTWVARSGTEPAGSALRALGPDLYAGLPGVAMFLAEFARSADCGASADLARAALRQAEFQTADVPAGQRAALYAGWTGMAVAEHRIAQTLDDRELLGKARKLGRLAAAASAAGSGQSDLITGDAGTLLGMLYLAEHFDEHGFLAAAIEAGDRLLNKAERNRHGVSWKTINRTREYRLTGLSHGAAGIAFALFRLAQLTGRSGYAAVARAALDYEQAWFDPGHGNWPDLRESRPSGSPARGARSFSNHWCHGAPGIALSRLAAHDATRDAAYLEQARVAIATTQRSLGAVQPPTPDECILCHGIVGNADILLTALRHEAQVVASGFGSVVAVAHGAADAIANAGTGDGLSALSGPLPGLMTGLSGAGWFFLRLNDPSVPSVLNGLRSDAAHLAHRCNLPH